VSLARRSKRAGLVLASNGGGRVVVVLDNVRLIGSGVVADALAESANRWETS